jgi:hypothetical protein
MIPVTAGGSIRRTSLPLAWARYVIDGKDVSQNKHWKDGSGGFTRGKHSRHDQNREHAQPAETCFRHADSNRRCNGEKPIDRCEVVHLVTE